MIHPMVGLRQLLCFLAVGALAGGCFTKVFDDDGERYAATGDWVVTGPQAAELYDQGALFLDARPHADYEASHLAGAQWVSWQDFSEPADPERGELLADDALLEELLRDLGVSVDRPVVVVGDPVRGWGEDGRIVWMLRTLGHPAVALLDGAYHALLQQGLPMSAGTEAAPPRGDFSVDRDPSLAVDRSDVQALVHGPDPEGTTLVDARERREYDGHTPYGESRGGHLPGAVHLHYEELLDSMGYLLPRSELLGELAGRGIIRTRPMIVYCTGGVRSGWFVVVLRDLGFPDVRNYAGSMWEWSAGPPTEFPLE